MFFDTLGLRAKLVLIFVIIKVIPLILLAWLAWSAAQHLGETLGTRAAGMADNMVGTIRQAGNKVTQDAIAALDDRSREAIERLTTDTARNIASFLYDRDTDVRLAAQLPLTKSAFEDFLANRTRLYCQHGPWKLREDAKGWESAEREERRSFSRPATPDKALPDNTKAFHARAMEDLGECASKPLYAEISFIDIQGRERIKSVKGRLLPDKLNDVSKKANTFVKAENYWPELKHLKPGEIYVSEVVGAYVGSHIVGVYTPETARKAGIDFEPEKSAYAGTENPVGKRFKGIVRWATPVLKDGKIAGYVTLALDHEHIRQFTDRIIPTEARYTPIIDAVEGNYAFIWDHKSRAIAHPRDYMIPGFDPLTGKEVAPWLDEETYRTWKASGQDWGVFSRTLKPFKNQSLVRKPAQEMLKAGTLGLDCRYLNFSPQCTGWNQLTEKGGSGSFEILFSGLRKLTTAAAIPYYTGQYGQSPQGFGFVTIGANVDDFHQAATNSARQISHTIEEKDRAFRRDRQGLLDLARESTADVTRRLSWSTVAMIVIVIGIAFWMASFLARPIVMITEGIKRFEAGDLSQRFKIFSKGELGQLSQALNRMAEAVQESFQRSEEARAKAESANLMKSEFLAAVTHELRTPLNGILGFTELLEMDIKDPMQLEHLETIKRSGLHLQRVVNDLLDMVKAESGKMILHPEPLELGPFMNDVIGIHYGHALGKGLVLALDLAEDLPEVISADSLRLRQALNNLINNAIKFTDDGRVLLRVSRHEDMLHMAVIDTGIGIPPEDLEAAFERFGGVGGKAQRDKGGTGLGLSLVRKLAALMGGRILVESAQGKGSTFTLIIPIHHPDSPIACSEKKSEG